MNGDASGTSVHTGRLRPPPICRTAGPPCGVATVAALPVAMSDESRSVEAAPGGKGAFEPLKTVW